MLSYRYDSLFVVKQILKKITSHARKIPAPDLIMVCVFLVLLVGLWVHPIRAFISDWWYHLAVTRAMLMEGGIPTHDWWSFQPVGRPHFYPPLLHIMIAAASRFTISNLITTSYHLGSLLYVGSLFTWWLFYRRFWGSGFALFATCLLTTVLVFTLSATSLMPAAIVVFLLPLFIMAIDGKYFSLAVVLLTLSFYSHLSLPWCMVLGVLLYARHLPKNKRNIFYKIALCGIILASPWIFHIIRSLGYLNVDKIFSASNPLPGIGPFGFLSHHVINIAWFVLVVWGFLRSSSDTSPGMRLTRIFCGALLPLLLFYGGRYFWHAAPLLTVFAVHPFLPHINSFFKKFTWQKLYVVFACGGMLLIPTVEFSFNSRLTSSFDVSPAWPAMSLMFMPTHDTADMRSSSEMAGFILAHSSRDTIVHVDAPALAEKIFVMTGMKVNNGQFWEVSDNITVQALRNTQYDIYVHRYLPLPADVDLDIVQNFGNYKVGIKK